MTPQFSVKILLLLIAVIGWGAIETILWILSWLMSFVTISIG